MASYFALYSSVSQWKQKMKKVYELQVPLSWRFGMDCGILFARETLICYFVDNESLFYRDGLYGYFDDGERYAFFSKNSV